MLDEVEDAGATWLEPDSVARGAWGRSGILPTGIASLDGDPHPERHPSNSKLARYFIHRNLS